MVAFQKDEHVWVLHKRAWVPGTIVSSKVLDGKTAKLMYYSVRLDDEHVKRNVSSKSVRLEGNNVDHVRKLAHSLCVELLPKSPHFSETVVDYPDEIRSLLDDLSEQEFEQYHYKLVNSLTNYIGRPVTLTHE